MPALVVLLVTAVLSATYVLAWDKVGKLWKKSGEHQSIEALEKKIAAGDKSAATWTAYGEALARAKDYGRAADAYREAARLEPLKKEAKFQCAVCLAHAGRANDLYDFLKELVYVEPKLTTDILDRPEMQKFGAQPRFAALKNEAHDQAMD